MPKTQHWAQFFVLFGFWENLILAYFGGNCFSVHSHLMHQVLIFFGKTPKNPPRTRAKTQKPTHLKTKCPGFTLNFIRFPAPQPCVWVTTVSPPFASYTSTSFPTTLIRSASRTRNTGTASPTLASLLRRTWSSNDSNKVVGRPPLSTFLLPPPSCFSVYVWCPNNLKSWNGFAQCSLPT